MKKYGFLKTFIGVCSGTSIFPEIVKFPFRRMVWHLFILAFLGAGINVAFRYHPIDVAYEETCKQLQAEFGNIVFSEKGMLPEKNPDKHGTVYMDDFRVDYFPKMEDLKDFKPEKESSFGFAWTPHSVTSWVLSDGKAVPVYPFLLPEARNSEEFGKSFSNFWDNIYARRENPMTLFEMAEIFKIPTEQFKATKVPFREFETNIIGIRCRIKTFTVIYLIGEILSNCLVSSPLYILVFAAFSFFLGRSSVLPLKFREIFVVGIYTGFPGIVIATLFTALNLPFLNFQSIFLMAYLFYSFPVFARLRFAQIQKDNMKNNLDDE